MIKKSKSLTSLPLIFFIYYVPKCIRKTQFGNHFFSVGFIYCLRKVLVHRIPRTKEISTRKVYSPLLRGLEQVIYKSEHCINSLSVCVYLYVCTLCTYVSGLSYSILSGFLKSTANMAVYGI